MLHPQSIVLMSRAGQDLGCDETSRLQEQRVLAWKKQHCLIQDGRGTPCPRCALRPRHSDYPLISMRPPVHLHLRSAHVMHGVGNTACEQDVLDRGLQKGSYTAIA